MKLKTQAEKPRQNEYLEGVWWIFAIFGAALPMMGYH
jgi:hypothetical protein